MRNTKVLAELLRIERRLDSICLRLDKIEEAMKGISSADVAEIQKALTQLKQDSPVIPKEK